MIEVRRVLCHVEDVFHEFGPPPAIPLRRGSIAAVIKNVFAGRYVQNIAPFMEELKPLGVDLAKRLLEVLDRSPAAIQGYGKAAVVGAEGELEHGALWHSPGGYGMREVLGWTQDGAAAGAGEAGPGRSALQPGNALAIVASTKKVGGPGTPIDVPLTHLNASYVRSHLDAIEVRVPGAPAADEVVYILAMSCGPRVHERLGGLRVDEIERWDGQK